MSDSNTTHDVIRSSLAIALGVLIGKTALSIITKSDDDGLSVVGDSSRVIAAYRALESLESEEARLFYDPLAFVLAGKKHIDACVRKAKRIHGADLHHYSSHRFYKITLNAARVWWFDQAILQALHRKPPPPTPVPSSPSSSSNSNNASSTTVTSASWLPASIKEAMSAGHDFLHRNVLSSTPIQQVVVIGSGMDTRPWRLTSLPPHIRWFEIDQQEVLDAKTKVLSKHGAHMATNTLANTRYTSTSTTTHTLKTASWTAVAADVSLPGWTRQLIKAGYNPAANTLWVMEGLLMYLDPMQGDQLLVEAAEQCGGFSMIVGHTVTDELMAVMQRKKGKIDYPPFERKLVNTWKSGLPRVPEKELLSVGWQLESSMSRAEIGRQICNSSGGSGSGGGGGVIKSEKECQGLCDFELKVGESCDRYAVFFTAVKVPGFRRGGGGL